MYTVYDFYDTRHLDGEESLRRIHLREGQIPAAGRGGLNDVHEYETLHDALDDATARFAAAVIAGEVAILTSHVASDRP